MKIVIIGAGMGGMSIVHILLEDPNLRVAGFVGTQEEEEKYAGKKLYGDIGFLGDHGVLPSLPKADIVGFVVGIRDNFVREKAYYEATRAGLTPVNAVSRHAVIEPSAKLGNGVVIGPGCVLAYGVTVADNTWIGAGSVIDVHTRVGENCYLYAGTRVAGECEIGRNATLGVGAIVEPFRRVGKNQEVAAGQVVREDLEDLARSHG